MKSNIIIVLCALLIGGCSAFRVNDNNKENIKGVPFYIKKGIVKQNTSYSRSWIEATINYYKINVDKKALGTERSAIFSISQSTYNQIELLKSFAIANEASLNGFGEAISTLHSLLEESCKNKINCEISPQNIANEADINVVSPSLLLQVLELNTTSYEAIVDYENPYYFNATVPPFGTTTASLKLAPDGTLSEVSSTVDSSKLADLIPLKELLVDKWGLGKIADKDSLAALAERDFAFTLSISINGYKYNLSKVHPYNLGLNMPPLGFDTDGISVSRTKFGNEPKKDDEKKKKAISIEGSIVLPEDK